MPAPTSEILAISGSCATPAAPISRASGSSSLLGPAELDFGSVNEMSVCPSAETFWTIMSTLTPASASARKTRAAIPGRSGTREDRHLGLRGVVRDPGDDRLLHRAPPD